MVGSLKVALAFLAANSAVVIAASIDVWPAEPWDLYAFAALCLGIPLAALAATLRCVARELPRPWGLTSGKAARPWQSAAATGLSLLHFFGGWAMFLVPFSH